MTYSRRPSPQTIAVLRALAEHPTRWRYGYDLCAELGVQAGTMYPILMRLADRGLLETDWDNEQVPGRPPRHLYRLTSAGHDYAAAHQPDPGPTPRTAWIDREAALPTASSSTVGRTMKTSRTEGARDARQIVGDAGGGQPGRVRGGPPGQQVPER